MGDIVKFGGSQPIEALAVHAVRDIEAGEELTLYYGHGVAARKHHHPAAPTRMLWNHRHPAWQAEPHASPVGTARHVLWRGMYLNPFPPPFSPVRIGSPVGRAAVAHSDGRLAVPAVGRAAHRSVV